MKEGEEKEVNFEGTVATDDFYSMAGNTKDQDDLKAEMVINPDKIDDADA